jgi:hypothetical protein
VQTAAPADEAARCTADAATQALQQQATHRHSPGRRLRAPARPTPPRLLPPPLLLLPPPLPQRLPLLQPLPLLLLQPLLVLRQQQLLLLPLLLRPPPPLLPRLHPRQAPDPLAWQALAAGTGAAGAQRLSDCAQWLH